jgi:hypothetical protein
MFCELNPLGRTPIRHRLDLVEAMEDINEVSSQASSIFEPFIEFLYHKVKI